jgi:hypothetical protein
MFLVLIASTSDDFPNLLNSPSVTSSMAKVLPQCHHYIQTPRAHFPDQFWGCDTSGLGFEKEVAYLKGNPFLLNNT